MRERCATRPGAYRHYLLLLLMVILSFAFVDRVALGVVLQSVKTDLRLTDTELGFLSGIAFALFYSVMGIPIARWADRGNRVRIISLTTALWSVAVALCGLAGSFAQLLVIRVGAAVGEAGAFPSGTSLIADYFSRIERPRAMSLYLLGGPVACVGGYFLAGWLNQLYGWRVTFMLIGAPGLLVAAVARLTLREPRNGRSTSSDNWFAQRVTEAPLVQASMREASVTLYRNQTFRRLLFCTSLFFFFIYGSLQWQPTFFIRSFGLTSGEIGTWFAVIYGLAGLLGTYLGGELASRYAARNERLQLNAVAAVMVSCAVLSALVYVSSNSHLALALLGGVSIALQIGNGPLYATLQTLAPGRMRAVAMALVMLFANLIGMGLGPLATGALSDALQPVAGRDSLRYALLILTPGYFWAAWFAWQAAKTVARDLEGVQVEQQLTSSIAAEGVRVG